MAELNLKISSSPHVRSKDTTSDIMFDVMVALMPALGFGLYLHGWYVLLLTAVCMLTCVGVEALFQKGMHRKVTVNDYSAALTGLLLALNLPPKLPVWMAVLGSAFAIIVVKQLFGGLGQNFMNPALGARCFLLLSFSKYMTSFVYDGVSTATPLAILKNGGSVSIRDMFFGYTAGTIGETSTIALLVGAAYLLIRRVISPKIPLIYIGTFAACIAIYALTKNYDVAEYTAAHICGGGLMLGAWFMATDYVTSPITPVGKIIYAIILGLLTFVLRIFGGSAEGVSFAIIISNLLVPLIERVTVPKAFGADAKAKGAEDKKEIKQEKEETTAEPEEVDKTAKTPTDFKGVMRAVIAICLITLFMGAALGTVYNITKEPIEKTEQQAKEEAYRKVYPLAYEIVPYSEVYDDVDDAAVLEALNEKIHDAGYTSVTIDEVMVALSDYRAGYVFLVTTSAGYGGDIQFALGITYKKEVTGLTFLKISETAGLGMEVTKPEFVDQFIGRLVSEFELHKGDASEFYQVDAVSGATITSTAVVDAINAVLICVKGEY